MNDSEKQVDLNDDHDVWGLAVTDMANDCDYKLSKRLLSLDARRDALVYARAAARKCLWRAESDLRLLNASDETAGQALKAELNLSTTATKSIAELQAALEQARKNYDVLDIVAKEVIHEWWSVRLDMDEWHCLALSSHLEEQCAKAIGLRRAIVQVRAGKQIPPLGKPYAPAIPKNMWPEARYIGEATGKWREIYERELRDIDQPDDE